MTSALKAEEKKAFNECLEWNSSRDRLRQRERERLIWLCVLPGDIEECHCPNEKPV